MDIGALIAEKVIEYVGVTSIVLTIEEKDRDDDLIDYTVRITSNRDDDRVIDFRNCIRKYLTSWKQMGETYTRSEYSESKMREARRQVFRMNRFVNRIRSWTPPDTLYTVQTELSRRAYYTTMPTDNECGDYVKLFTTSHEILIRDVSVIRCTILTLRRILNR